MQPPHPGLLACPLRSDLENRPAAYAAEAEFVHSEKFMNARPRATSLLMRPAMGGTLEYQPPSAVCDPRQPRCKQRPMNFYPRIRP
jgi:hypothetical protein